MRKLPHVRLPYDRMKVVLNCDPEEGRTHQSFKDECDINRIIDTHHRTGIVTHVARLSPQYGENPETDIFEAACVQAEIRSAEEDGFEFREPESRSEASEEDSEGKEAESSREAREGASEAAEGDRSGDTQ